MSTYVFRPFIHNTNGTDADSYMNVTVKHNGERWMCDVIQFTEMGEMHHNQTDDLNQCVKGHVKYNLL
jgi:hypothetical protein